MFEVLEREVPAAIEGAPYENWAVSTGGSPRGFSVLLGLLQVFGVRIRNWKSLLASDRTTSGTEIVVPVVKIIIRGFILFEVSVPLVQAGGTVIHPAEHVRVAFKPPDIHHRAAFPAVVVLELRHVDVLMLLLYHQPSMFDEGEGAQ